MKINTLILGKSGVGKSALLNYLWGDKIAKVGTGRPVTPQSKGNHVGLYRMPPVNIGEHELVIFDSWGLEADQAERWTKTITSEMEKREQDSNMENWFHAVIYCISAAGARIEAFELDKVITPLSVQGQAITFVLTKADIASEAEIAALEAEINKAYPNNGGIIKVCSEKKTLRGGREELPRGKEELFNSLTKNLAKKLRTKLAAKFIDECKRASEIWKASALELYDEEASLFQSTGTTLEKIGNKIKLMLDIALCRTNDWMRQNIDKVESLEAALQHVTHSRPAQRVDSSTVFTASSLQWDYKDHLIAFGKHLIPIFNIYYVFTAKSTHREELENKLDETIKDIARSARSSANHHLMLALTERPSVFKTSTNSRPESTIHIRRIMAGYSD